VRPQMFSLANIVAEKRVVPELIQWDFTPEKLCARYRELMAPGALETMRTELGIVAEKMGGPGASERAAKEILDCIS